jgi:DNA-binding XRE family transcriptional regulator
VTDRQILRVIATNVKKARQDAGLTQECLAELVGVHWQTISYLEKGRHPFAVTNFIRICHALDLSPNRLIDGLPEPDIKRMEKIKKALVRKRKPKQGAG